MDRGLAVVLTALVGGCIALQAPINSQLGKAVGTFQAAFVSFTIGTVLLVLIAALAKGGIGQVAGARIALCHGTGGQLSSQATVVLGRD